MNIAYKLADVLYSYPPPPAECVDIGPECFGATFADGTKIICWQGENYVRQQPSLRVRLHNWLNGIGNRQAT